MIIRHNYQTQMMVFPAITSFVSALKCVCMKYGLQTCYCCPLFTLVPCKILSSLRICVFIVWEMVVVLL